MNLAHADQAKNISNVMASWRNRYFVRLSLFNLLYLLIGTLFSLIFFGSHDFPSLLTDYGVWIYLSAILSSTASFVLLQKINKKKLWIFDVLIGVMNGVLTLWLIIFLKSIPAVTFHDPSTFLGMLILPFVALIFFSFSGISLLAAVSGVVAALINRIIENKLLLR